MRPFCDAGWAATLADRAESAWAVLRRAREAQLVAEHQQREAEWQMRLERAEYEKRMQEERQAQAEAAAAHAAEMEAERRARESEARAVSLAKLLVELLVQRRLAGEEVDGRGAVVGELRVGSDDRLG